MALIVIACGFWWDSQLRRRQINHAHIDRFHILMSELTKEAEKYWARGYVKDADSVSSAKINGISFHLISVILDVIEFDNNEVKNKFMMSLGELNHIVTGGQFQSQDRVADPSRIQRMLVKSGQILSDIEKAIQ